MKTLLAPARAVKAIDQVAQSSEYYPGTYIPIENLQHWTGMGLSAQAALNYIAVYQCVRVLANTFAMLPLKLYRRLPEERKEPATDHPLYRPLHLAPNPDMTSFVWRKLMMTHIATWGNHYSEIVLDQMGRMMFYPMRPDRVEPKYDAEGNRVYDYLDTLGRRRRLRPGSVLHLQGQTSNGLMGSSPIADLRSTLSLSQTAEQYGSSVFRNGARPAVVLSHPATLSDPAVKRLAGQMDELRGSGNAGKTVVLEEGMTVNPIGFPPEDAQFMQTRLMQHRLIYGAYGIPPHKVGDLERATFSNIEHQSLEFIQDGIMPWLVNAEQEFSVQLPFEDDVFPEFLVDGYLRGDAKARAEAFAIRWQHGSLSPDEWRAKENENPLADGVGQQYYVPVNYKPAGLPAQDEAPSKDSALPVDEPPALYAIKSLRCPGCSKLLAEAAPPGTRIACPRCKAVAEAGVEQLAAKSIESQFDDLPERIAAAFPRPQPLAAPEVHFHEGAFKAGDVHVAPAAIERGAVQVNVAAPPAAKAPVVKVDVPAAKPVHKSVKRTGDGSYEITEIVEA